MLNRAMTLPLFINSSSAFQVGGALSFGDLFLGVARARFDHTLLDFCEPGIGRLDSRGLSTTLTKSIGGVGRRQDAREWGRDTIDAHVCDLTGEQRGEKAAGFPKTTAGVAKQKVLIIC